MKILFINQVVGPLFAEFVSAKCGDENETTILCGSGGDLVKNCTTDIVLGPAYDKASIIKRFVSWVTFSFFVFRYVWRNGRLYDLVVFTTNSPLNNLSIALLYLFGRINAIEYMIYDIYPEVIFLRWPWSKFLCFPLMIFRFIDSFVVMKSDRVFTLSKGMALTLHNRREIGRDITISVLPVVASEPKVHQNIIESRNEVEEIIDGKLNNFVLVYSGNLGVQHDLSNLIKVVQKPILEGNVSLIVCGDGELRNQYVRAVVGSRNVWFLPFQEEMQFNNLLNCADISVVSLGGGFGNILMPSKFATYISFGLPVLLIGDESSELAGVIKDNHIGWTFSDSDIYGVEKLLLSIIQKDITAPTRLAVKEYFNNFHTEKALKKVLNENC